MSLRKAGFGGCEDRGEVCTPLHPCLPYPSFQTAYVLWETGQFKVNNYHYCQKSSECPLLMAQLNSSQVNKLKEKAGVGQNREPGVWTFHRQF